MTTQLLASDLNNPEFQGAVDPNALMYVEFYWNEPIDKWATEHDPDGKVIRLPRQPFVRIMRPGDQTSILEVPVNEDHKRRWPQKWLYFQIKEGLVQGDANIPGWKIEEWEETNGDDTRLTELKYLRFYTVEQIAGASDAQVQRLGLGGFGLREKARLALGKRGGAELARKEAEIEALKKAQAEMAAQLQQLLARQSEPASPPPPQPEQPNEVSEPRAIHRRRKKAKRPKRQLSPEHLAKLKAGRDAYLAKIAVKPAAQ